MRNVVELQSHLIRFEKLRIPSPKGDETLASETAFSIIEIQESMNLCLNELFPKLMDRSLNEADLEELLLDIGEEFRHILYHINDMTLYDHLHDSNNG